jgi:predicted transcriptional regulator
MRGLRDIRKQNWFWIGNYIIDHGHMARLGVSFMVYAALCRRASADTGEAFPSYDTLCEDTGLSRATISKAIKQLIVEGLVTIKRKGGLNRGGNVYLVHDVNQTGLADEPDLVQQVNCKKTNTNNTQLTTSAPSATKKPANPIQNEVRSHFELRYQQAFGKPFVWSGKEAGICKRLCAACNFDLGAVVSAIDAAFLEAKSNTFRKDRLGGGIAGVDINKHRPPSPASPTKPKAVTGDVNIY